MQAMSNAVSQARANFMDSATYLVPGGVLLFALLLFSRDLTGTDYPGILRKAVFTKDVSGWQPALIVAGLLLGSYVIGLLLGLLDWFVTCLSPPDDGWDEDRARSSRKWVMEYAGKHWGWVRPPGKPTRGPEKRHTYWVCYTNALRERARAHEELRGMTETWVALHAPALDAWVHRYRALENLCGGLAWAFYLGLTACLVGFRSTKWSLPLGWEAATGLAVAALASFFLFKAGQQDYGYYADRTMFDSAFHLLKSARTGEGEAL